MKKVLTLCLTLLASPAAADPQSAMNAVRSIPGILNAQEDSGGNLWVMVQDNGKSPWNDIAANLCKVVRPHEARIFLVKIVDVASIKPKSKPREWAMLGGANCGMVP